MARFIAALIATLMVLGTPAAYAAQPAHPSHPGAPFAHRGDHEHADATYALRGTLSNYVAPSATANGSITVTVSAPTEGDSPLTGTVLTGTALSFAVTPATRIVLHGASAITNGDRGTVLVRAPKGASATTLEASPALAVIDQAQSGTDLGDHQGRQEHADGTYALRGTLTNYVAPSATTMGSITVTLLPPRLWDLNLTGTALTGPVLTFAITTQTRIVLRGASAITNGDRGTVLVRAPKGASATTLEASPALAVIDQAQSGADLGDHRGDHQHADATYALRGTLSNYVAPSATTSGSITVTLLPPRLWDLSLTGTALTGTTLTFAITMQTRIVLHGAAAIANGDRGTVLVRAPKGARAATLEASPVLAVVDQAYSSGDRGEHRGRHEQGSDMSYVIRGTLSNFVAPSATANGSVTVTLAPPRFWGAPLTGTALTGTALTFAIATTTRIVLHGAASIANGDPGLVKVRAPRGSSLSVIEATPASAVIDRAGSH